MAANLLYSDRLRDADNYVTFSLNGKIHKVWGLPAGTTLLQYIREHAHLKGTKYMCREGGCGSCIVNLTFTDPVTGIDRSFGINSCLYALYSCQGMSVTTIEGIGSKQKGYNPVQTRLANFCGSQCGFCSPGWVMAMYSLLKTDKDMSMKQIEDSFGSNNCRCTGYRPILEAFKTFAENRTVELHKNVGDIEDLMKGCSIRGDHIKSNLQSCAGNPYKEIVDVENIFNCQYFEPLFVELALSPTNLCVDTKGSSHWYKVTKVQEIFEIFTMINGSYMLVGGNTAQGVFEEKYPTPPDIYIDINGVLELKSHSFNSVGDLVLGANKSLTDTITLFRAVAVEKPESFSYLKILAKHMTKVAHIPVRNVGTLAGNLSAKYVYPRFPSDLFTIFETVGAQLIIDSGSGLRSTISLSQFLQINMCKRVITNIVFKPFDETYIVRTYKVMRRAQNDHAVVNAGFCFSFNRNKNFKVLQKPRIVYGGVRPDFIHAIHTESYLEGKCLLNTATLQKTLSILSAEVVPDRQLPESSEQYRNGLASSLFYRFVLGLSPSSINPKFRSGGEEISRPLSSGRQEYFTDPQQYPLTQPMPKVESLIQCSGEIEYTNDIPPSQTELFASLVLTDRGPATLAEINPQPALSIPGVVAFLSAKDIPGVNTFANILKPVVNEHELLFVEKDIQYAGQAAGVILANSQDLADYAARRVVLKYTNVKKPLLYVDDVLREGDKERIILTGSIEPTSTKDDVEQTIKGSFSYKGQYFYFYETLTCIVYPRDNNTLDVVLPTQWMQHVQEAISKLLNISSNRINVTVKRCGGGFGGKISRATLPACACALAAYLLQRPVRIVMDLESNMRAVGGRYLFLINYEAGVDNEGVIQYLKGQFYSDKGVALNDSGSARISLPVFPNVYDSSTWSVDFYDVRTDKATTTYLRAPGSLSGIGAIEHIMEHIAWTVKKDPLSVRLNNMMVDSPIPSYISDLKGNADYNVRVQHCREFNRLNQWKKRGISLVPMRFKPHYRGVYHALLSIFRNDATVAISLGVCEMGHGINTKVAQIAAHELGIPLVYIQVKASSNLTAPNDIFTGASTSSDGVCFAVRKCCQKINSRLEPLRRSVGPDTPWTELIEKAYQQRIDLNTTYMFRPEDDEYNLYGLCALEVEIDCLTGEHRVVRVDLLQNTGTSLNPYIDIGQVEGAFLMGLGHFTSEELIFNPTTGLLTTDRTWEYKVPGAKDIPEDWRIHFCKDPNGPPVGVYGSKSQGEAPLVMSVSVVFAIRRAIESLHRDLGLPDTFFNNNPPCTTENIFLRCGSKIENYTL